MTAFPFAPFPPPEIRQQLPTADWETCLDTWISLAELHLRLDEKAFASIAGEEDSSLVLFLGSFFNELPRSPATEAPKFGPLRKQCFLLVRRLLAIEAAPPQLLHWRFLAALGHAFPRSDHLRITLRQAWAKHTAHSEKSLLLLKSSSAAVLESQNPEAAMSDLRLLCHLLSVSPDAATFMVTGSDFLDASAAAYPKSGSSLQPLLIRIAYLGLSSLLKSTKPNYSVFSDNLYSLRTTAGDKQSAGAKSSFLGGLVSRTPLLDEVEDRIPASEGAKVKKLASSLREQYASQIAAAKKLSSRPVHQQKQASSNHSDPRLCLISNVRDLFPQLGHDIVDGLLKDHNDDVARVTTHILDNSMHNVDPAPHKYVSISLSLPKKDRRARTAFAATFSIEKY